MRWSFLNFILFALFLQLSSFNSFANSAKVIMLKGLATQLAPGAHIAKKIEQNDILMDDTSILTAPDSFLQIRYHDGTLLNLGPKTKLIINKINSSNKPQVVSLLTGRLRAEVTKSKGKEKNQKFENKFFIKTRNAAMGVRGTEFETIYNPKLNSTSLVTYEGEVAMVKTNNKIFINEEKNKNTKVNIENSLDKELKNKNQVLVKEGRFSGVVERLDNATIPVKISPEQFKVLAQNNKLKKNGPEKKEKISEVLTKDEDDPSPDGYYDEATGTMAPKAGGYLDRDSGLYIPPPKGSELDTKLNVYIPPKEIGVVDSKGDYIAPEGLKIDSEKGIFVASNSQGEAQAQTEKAKELLDEALIDSPTFKKNDEVFERMSHSQSHRSMLPMNLGFHFGFVENSIKTNSKNSSSSQENSSNLGPYAQIKYGLQASKLFEIYSELGFKYFNYSQSPQKPVYQGKKSFWSLGVGTRYELNQRFYPLFLLKREEKPLVNTPNEARIKYITQNVFIIGLDSFLIKNEDISSVLSVAYKHITASRGNDVNAKSGRGILLKLGFSFSLPQNDQIGASVFINHDEFETDESKIRYDEKGLGIHFTQSF